MKTTNYDVITQYFIDALEQGIIPWQKPWNFVGHQNYSTKKSYTGVNILILSISREINNFNHSLWMTYKQAQALGGAVRKGEHGTQISYYNIKEEPKLDDFGKPMRDATGKEMTTRQFFLKTYSVFNVDQIDGLELEVEEPVQEKQPIEACQAIVDGYDFKLQHNSGESAHYNIQNNEVVIPEPKLFSTMSQYYLTLFHEMIHSTGHKYRLNRKMKNKMGDTDYAKEELVAEIGACMLISTTGIEVTFENNKAYVQSWIAKLKNDPKFILQASSQAQKAVNFIIGEV